MLTMPPTLAIYVCEAFACPPQGTRHDLGAHAAKSPRLALRWLQRRTEDVADQLDPPAAQPGRHWLRDEREHEHALARLVAGEPYGFTMTEAPTRYVLTVRPTS